MAYFICYFFYSIFITINHSRLNDIIKRSKNSRPGIGNGQQPTTTNININNQNQQPMTQPMGQQPMVNYPTVPPMGHHQPMVQPMAQPMMAQPMMAQPMMVQPMMAQPMMTQPMMAQPMAPPMDQQMMYQPPPVYTEKPFVP